MRNNLRRVRKAKDLSVEEAAKLTGTTEHAWYKWERGTRSPSIPVARRIAKCLEVSLDELFGDTRSTKEVS